MLPGQLRSYCNHKIPMSMVLKEHVMGRYLHISIDSQSHCFITK